MCESCKGLTDIPLTLDVIPIHDLTLTVFAPTLAVLVSVKEFIMRVLMWRCNDRMRRDENRQRGFRTIARIYRAYIYHDHHHYSVDLFGAGGSNRPGHHHQDYAVSYALG